MAVGERKPDYTSTFLCNVCVMFTKFPLTKAIVKGLLEPERKEQRPDMLADDQVLADGTPRTWATRDTAKPRRSL